MSTLLAADNALTILEAMALEQEEANHHGSRDKRTVEHVIDPTPYAGAGYQARIRLLVIAGYSKWAEQLLAVAATASAQKALEKHPQTPKLAYGCFWEDTALGLTREQAVRLLYERELPLNVREWVLLRRTEPEADDGWLQSFFATQGSKKQVQDEAIAAAHRRVPRKVGAR